jgi:hypothetical protein
MPWLGKNKLLLSNKESNNIQLMMNITQVISTAFPI